jgi:hypothetical protein
MTSGLFDRNGSFTLHGDFGFGLDNVGARPKPSALDLCRTSDFG